VIGIRPAMASTPLDREVQKAPVIQRATLCCIFFSSLMFLTTRAIRKANSEPEFSQLLFISVRQRELIRVLAVLS